MKVLLFLLLTTMVVQSAIAGTSKSITFSWIWLPGGSGYTAGTNGDVAYDLYMRTENDPGFTYDFPLIGGIQNCWWNQDRYTCQTLNYEFELEVRYYFVVIAYLVEDTTRRSLNSNQVEYYFNSAGGSGGGGGGCFIACGIKEPRFMKFLYQSKR